MQLDLQSIKWRRHHGGLRNGGRQSISYARSTCVMWRSVIDYPKISYKADSNQLNSLLDSVEWDGALRDVDINNA